ncbi:MAG TPA: regulatory protein RecX [Bacteroidales bacterium]|nr:regulatory protein RecX [Bacteroidales bacterium]
MSKKESYNATKALNRLQKICSMQEKCPADILLLLNRWGIAPEHHPEIINRLKAENFLDENRYASAFVKDKIRFGHWGFIKISYFLRQKGIPGKIADEACKSIDRDDYSVMIAKELEKKKKTLKGPPREVWAKLARYGSSRGYEMEYMREFLDSIGTDE